MTLSRRFAAIAFGWCAVVGLALALVPGSRSTSCTANSEAPTSICTSTSRSLLQEEGASVLAVLAIPAVATGLPLVVRRRAVAIAGAVVVSALALLGIASIGLFLLPGAALAWCAVADKTTEPRPATSEA